MKTIYISYTDADRNIVASVHPDPKTDRIEVALSIAQVEAHPLLHDGAHLKWRTLPVAIRLSKPGDVTAEVEEVLDLAVAGAAEMVPRPVEDFFKHDRLGRSRRGDPST